MPGNIVAYPTELERPYLLIWSSRIQTSQKLIFLAIPWSKPKPNICAIRCKNINAVFVRLGLWCGVILGRVAAFISL